MMTQENIQNVDETLAERCRVALEKSYGFKIPVPKAARKSRRHL
jgi:hypothetical protein